MLSDPWAARGLHLLPVLRGRRRRYSALSRRWTEDDVLAKMEARPFANGSMRQCFAMKKLSTFSAFRSWLLAGNFVAKVYMNAVEDQAYTDDVQLQMEAKRFGDAYNARNPPKKARRAPRSCHATQRADPASAEVRHRLLALSQRHALHTRARTQP